MEAPAPLETELVAPPPVGRRFVASRRVRWGDADRHGRVRLDAVARYLQDVANDDTRDAGHDPMAPWVVRRTTIVEVTPARNGEVLELTTFNGGTGSRWAERRTAIRGDRGAQIEAASVWISVDPVSGRPVRLTEQFLSTYGEAGRGRKVDARLRLPGPPVGARRRGWPVRSTDLDQLGHVNNAATWEPIEDELDRRGIAPRAALLEYGDAIEPGDEVEVLSAEADGVIDVWLTVGGAVRAAARVVPRPPEGAP